MHGARLTGTPSRSRPRWRRFRHNRMWIDRLVGSWPSGPTRPLRTHSPSWLRTRCGGGGAYPAACWGWIPRLRHWHAPRSGGASAPPFTGNTAGPGRAGVGCPWGGTGEGAGIRTGAEGPAAAPLITAGATGAGRSSGRSTEGAGLGATGVVTGPAAAGGTTGFGGGGGETHGLARGRLNVRNRAGQRVDV